MTSETPQVPTEIETFVAAAREYVRRAIGIELDGTDTSLAFIDHYVDKTVGVGPLDDQVLKLVAGAIGAYFGQVAIGRFGGHWVVEGDDPARWRVELEPVELRFFPVGMAAEALRQDEVPGYDSSFVTRQSLMALLGEALATAPPVDEHYYYSLTGRLETLEHAVEILVEFERRRSEAAPKPN